MDLDAALARVGELEGQVATLVGERDGLARERDTLIGERDDLAGRLDEASSAHEAASGDLAADLTTTRLALTSASERGLGYLRRALLAEQAGQVVPELVAGDDEAALLASVEVARQAYARAVEGARAAIVGQVVPAGAPSARAVSAAGLSPLEMIESGLRR